MTTWPIAEFRDPDGSYALVQPFDEVRCRVISSNVLSKGLVLYKHADLTWEEAARESHGGTRVGPSDLAALEERRFESSDYRDLIRGEVAEDPDPLRDLEDTRSTRLEAAEVPADPRAGLLRLAFHYRKVHERREAGGRWMSVCRCPGFTPEGKPGYARLHAMIWVALFTKRLPSLPRMLGAIRVASEARTKAA